MAKTRWLFSDNFEDGVQNLPTLAGNGSVTESGGELNHIVGAGQNADWWTFGRNGILPYQLLNLQPQDTKVTFETELAAITIPVPATSHMMVGLWLDDGNFVYVGYDNTNVWMGGTVGFATWWSGGTTPISIPFKIRFIWDIPNKEIKSQYNTGGGWVDIYTRTSDATRFDRTFFYSKNYSSFPAITSNFSYSQAFVEEAEVALAGDSAERGGLKDEITYEVIDPNSAIENGVGRSGGMQDDLAFPTAGGPPDHTFGVGRGQLVPGPVNQQPGSVGPFDGGGLQDDLSFPTAGGDRVRHTSPEVGSGLLLALARGDRPQPAGSLEDDLDVKLGGLPTYRPDTLDGESHNHLIGRRPYVAFLYDTSGEPWANPVANGLTGYARDGYEYIAGVQQMTQAPWATETASVDRSARSDFPTKALIVVSLSEIVIYDLVSFPSIMNVWMRFRIGPSGSFYMVGRVDGSVQDVMMINGVLIVATSHNGIENGGVFTIDFKATGQNFLQLIRADNHWWGVGGRDITDRNITGNYTTTGVSPSLRLNNESVYSLQAWRDASNLWVVHGGEDANEIINYNATNAGQRSTTTPQHGNVNIGDIRNILIDRIGGLWHTVEKTLVRNMFDYQQDVISHAEDLVPTKKFNKLHNPARHKKIDLPYNITSIVEAGDYIYAGTEVGVYQIHKGTMTWWLAYTVPGGGGGGRLNNDPDGEILAGTKASVERLYSFSISTTRYLEVTTRPMGGGATLIRLRDDVALALEYASLVEDGAFFQLTVGV